MYPGTAGDWNPLTSAPSKGECTDERPLRDLYLLDFAPYFS